MVIIIMVVQYHILIILIIKYNMVFNHNIMVVNGIPSHCYHYIKKNGNFKIEFFVMDSNFDVLTKKQKSNQFRKLKKWIKSSKAHWKILIGRHTWESVGYHGGENPEFQKLFTKTF